MCGFLFVFDIGGIDSERCISSLATLARRGPDDSGYILDCLKIQGLGLQGAAHKPNMFLGHRRLAIIGDASENCQPMRRGSVMVAFNGEIYNFLYLRRYLESKGVEFKESRSDTEVLLLGIEKEGVSFLSRLNGMFAGVFVNLLTGAIILFRDQVGQKPAYLYRSESEIIFASEIKAITRYKQVPVTMEPAPTALVLGYSVKSFFTKVDSLAPGEYLSGTPEQFLNRRAIRGLARTASHRRKGCRSHPAETTEVLKDAVRRNLIADVPLGLHLSGGVDSTLLACIVKELRVETVCFNIGFLEEEYDESQFAKQAAVKLGLPFITDRIDPTLDEINDILDYFDEPFFDSSAIPTYFLNKMASEHVKVVLGGDGADELFWGYKRYRYTDGLLALSKLFRDSDAQGIWLKLVSRVFANRPEKKYLINSTRSIGEALFRNSHDWNILFALFPSERAEMLYCNAFADYISCSSDSISKNNFFWFDCNNYLARDILIKSDRSSMAHGIEQRAPFLDSEVIEHAVHLDKRYMKSLRNGKKPLKKILESYGFTHDFTHRKKQGFRFPLSKVIATHSEPIFETAHTAVRKLGIDTPLFLGELCKGQVKEPERIWKLYVLGRFLERTK